MSRAVGERTAYQEPSDGVYTTTKLKQVGRSVVHATVRTSRIDAESITYEPFQDGVLRYPPVQVQVERDPEAVRDYIEMPPTDNSVWADKARAENT